MKKYLQRAAALALALMIAATAAVPALASEAMGEDIHSRDTLLHEQTQLATSVFWSSAFEDYRTEHLITYTPNRDVRPIVTYGGAMTDRSTISDTAKALEQQGHRVVAGVNGDYFNLSTGLPVGITVADGRLLSSDAGTWAVGFREDGTALLGRPQVKLSLDTGHTADDGTGTLVPVVRSVAAVNKGRLSEGGIFLYTYEFSGKRNTGATEPGIDLICSVVRGELAIGQEVKLRVERVSDGGKAVPIAPGQMVLSANLRSNSYYVDALRRIRPGETVTVKAEAADPAWNDMEYAVGALYSLVENGAVVPNKESKAAPRTAVGQRPDGTLLFYTMDGRRAGHSIGANMDQLSRRLMELGCVTALCLDGGGSTALTVTQPDDTRAELVNLPSGKERTVSNQIFLVADNRPSNVLHHFYVEPEHSTVLAGSSVAISAAAVDSHYIPMDRRFTLRADRGELEDNILTTPRSGGTITVTASGGGRRGETTVEAVTHPDHVAIRREGSTIDRLSVAPGTVTRLSGAAAYRHRRLHADPTAFDWTFSGDCGTIDPETGDFTAVQPGTGTLTVSAGGRSASLPVTVTTLGMKTVEDFENDLPGQGHGHGIHLRPTGQGEPVRYGRTAMALDYDLSRRNAERDLTDPLHVSGPYTALRLWVWGDQSGNILEFTAMDADGRTDTVLTLPLDFSGWQNITIPGWNQDMALQGFRITGTPERITDQGRIFIDQVVAGFPGEGDAAVPVVRIHGLEGDTLRAFVEDGRDGILSRDSLSVTVDRVPAAYHYDEATGRVAVPLTDDGQAHRVTITAEDASGNLGRGSYDVPAAPGTPARFTDTAAYWGRTYVDYLYTAGITTGFSDGSFRPNSNISRAQFTVMLFRYLGLDERKYAEVELPFDDADELPEYALPAIRALYTEGIVNGTRTDEGLFFYPGNSLTRAQAASMIGRTQVKGYDQGKLNFTDAGMIPEYAREFIATMAAQNIINGYPDGSFLPHRSITRGQMAKILYNLM